MSGSYDFNKLSSRPNTPQINRRKFSFPVALHSSLLLGENNAQSARRRLSNVSDVVTRKLSSTIGWKNAIPAQEIISQGKCLCGQYVRSRLKRAGIFNRKLGLQRILSIIGTPSLPIVREVYQVLNCIGEELERMHPRTYSNISRQVSRSTGGEFQTVDTAPLIISAIARYLFKSDITWSKIISLYALTGGIAVDCVRQGHPEYLPKLVEGLGEVIEDELVPWINDNGGWLGLNSHVKMTSTEFQPLEWGIWIVGCVFGFCFIIFILKIIGYQVIPCLFSVT